MRRTFKVKRGKILELPVLANKVEDTVFWDMMKHGITQSSMSTFSTCPMKAKLKLIDGLEGGHYNPALDFGSLFHDVLDKVYSQRVGIGAAFGNNWRYLCDKTLQAKYDEVLGEDNELSYSELNPVQEQEFERLWGMCGVVLPMYFKRWNYEDTKTKWIAIEQVFEFPFKLKFTVPDVTGYPVEHTVTITIKGKWDGLIEDKSGGIWLFETKTKKDIEDMGGNISCNALVEKMSYELQVMVYCIAIYHKYGKWPKGVIYNLIKRPGQEFKGTFNRKPENLPQYFERIQKDMNEKGDAYFKRYTISLDPSEFIYYRDNDLQSIVGDMYQWYLRGGNPSKRVSAACSMWRKPCEFLSICSGEDKIRSGYSKRKLVFPELVEVDD